MAAPHGELVFAPLGGVGEIGMNLSIYGLGDERQRTWLVGRSRRVVRQRGAPAGHRSDPAGHPLSRRGAPQPRRHRAHPRARGPFRRAARPVAASCKVPVYATPFTAALLEAKRAGRAGRAGDPDQGGAARRALHVGPFDIEFVSVAHSIPESNALIIRTPLGNVLHTGDWKIDPTPVHRPADRRGQAARAGRGGLPRADRRFHQRGARGPLAVGSRRRARRSPN